MSYTAEGLVAYVKSMLTLHTTYMWGGIMRLVTTAYVNGKKAQYPSWYTAARTQKFLSLVGKSYYGVDCVGLIKSYYWGGLGSKSYQLATDKDANGMYLAATEKGPISTIPEIPGICVWMTGHIGVYIGNGNIIESTNNTVFGDGVCQTKLSARKWTNWLKCPYISYPAPSVTPTAPAVPESAAKETVYTVKSGDTLSKIAVAHGTTYTVLAKYNNIAQPNLITVGQKIKIPVK